MNKRVVFWIKVVVLAAVVVFLGKELVKAWGAVTVHIDWRWGSVAVAGFCINMLVSAVVWRWLAGRMGESATQRISESANEGDWLPTGRLVGAYIFSQVGKYVPGKVALLLMRVERAKRFGMAVGVTTLSTLLENGLYVISGGLVSMMAIVRVLEELHLQGKITAAQEQWQWPVVAAAVVVLAAACHPAVFYGVVNRALRRMKKPEVPVDERLGMGTLALAVLGFVPCWIFGGVAMWASTMCVHAVDLWSCWWFAGAFALSVILGMVSLMPGGLVVREAVLGAAVTIQLSPVVGHAEAVLLGGAAAVLQRLFQVVAEVLMGGVGAAVTSGGAGMTNDR